MPKSHFSLCGCCIKNSVARQPVYDAVVDKRVLGLNVLMRKEAELLRMIANSTDSNGIDLSPFMFEGVLGVIESQSVSSGLGGAIESFLTQMPRLKVDLMLAQQRRQTAFSRIFQSRLAHFVKRYVIQVTDLVRAVLGQQSQKELKSHLDWYFEQLKANPRIQRQANEYTVVVSVIDQFALSCRSLGLSDESKCSIEIEI